MILVTGGLGMIGAHTAQALLDLGHRVAVTSHRQTKVPSFLTGQILVERLDVTDRHAFLALADRHDVTDIIHLADSIPGEDPVALFPHGRRRPAQRTRACTCLVSLSVGSRPSPTRPALVERFGPVGW